DLVGQFIDQGRLKLVDTLGSGSNGVVFLAIDTTSSPQYPTYYAVKCLIKADKGSHLHDVQQQEIAHHMRCSAHSNVITLHRVVEEHFYLFLVLDYCSGGDFFQFLFEGGIPRGDDALVKKLFLQIIDGVEACHQMGIYHRDIKPENILVNESGTRVFLSDFGLSTGRAFSRTYGAGSSYYMSPECIGIHGPITPYSTRANDVWALGVILTAMISGHNPWRRATYTDECYRAYLQDQDFLYRTLPISSGANDILQRIFTSDPSRRITIPFLRLKIMQVDTF
ncbi:kinase-like protein, partial [Wolfiporia cocos MD-104 SS10]